MNSIEYRRIQGLVGEQSFSLILPKQYAINLGIRKGDFVKVWLEENKIIIEKASNKNSQDPVCYIS
jgi:bifunctional DNA-binding transcriptional regulator/antitoxin component of YhaV-PrlF toxin-antitoxin module